MRMTTFHVLAMLLMLSLNPGVKADCETNGCSVWSIVPYKHFFRPACNKHDVCYACGDDYEWDRLQCDVAFKKDMYKMCDTKTFTKLWCKGWAWLYYKAVRIFGKTRYEAPSLDWCDNCAKSRGDPTKLVQLR